MEPTTFTCATCGTTRTGKNRRCFTCKPVVMSSKTRQKIRDTLKGVSHSDERRANIQEGRLKAKAEGRYRRDPGSHTRGKPAVNAVPLGTERAQKDTGRVQVKTESGWKWRARIVWEAANGPLPRGRLIHHINEDCTDDRLDNLMMVTRGEHLAIHNALRAEKGK